MGLGRAPFGATLVQHDLEDVPVATSPHAAHEIVAPAWPVKARLVRPKDHVYTEPTDRTPNEFKRVGSTRLISEAHIIPRGNDVLRRCSETAATASPRPVRDQRVRPRGDQVGGRILTHQERRAKPFTGFKRLWGQSSHPIIFV